MYSYCIFKEGLYNTIKLCLKSMNLVLVPLLTSIYDFLSIFTLYRVHFHVTYKFYTKDNMVCSKFYCTPFEPVSKIMYNLCCAYSVESYKSANPHSLIRVLVFCLKRRWILGYPKSARGRLLSACADSQADLSLRWAHMSACTGPRLIRREI